MSEQFVLVDASERELAGGDLSTTYLVEAAAGTGKTTILVERVITILRETLTPITRIVAITFTEKAAGELKSRIRAKIESDIALERDNEDHLARALLELERMTVGTIHSFCRDILRAHAIEAGLDPEFALLDESVAGSLKTQVWQRWLRHELEQEPTALRDVLDTRLFATLSSALTCLESIYRALIDERAELKRIHIAEESATERAAAVDRFLFELHAHCALISECRYDYDTLAEQILSVRAWAETYETQEPVPLLRWLLAAPTLSGNRRGRAEHWKSAEALAEARRYFLTEHKALLAQHTGRACSALCAPLVEWLKHAVRAYQEAKEQRSVLDFDDLLIRARDLVRDSETARTALKERFDYLLVDEYQDTDPLQTEIVFLLAEKAERFAAHWTDVELEHGKLFIVGDPKQSIYRFRRADMDLYKLVRDKIAETGVVLNIRVNFRSDARILVEINELFRPLIQPGPDTHYEPEYVDLAWPAQTRTDTGSGAPLVFLTAPADATRTFSAAEAAAFEAGLIADFIGREVAGGAIAFRDFAILFETRTGLPALETALRARAIPYQTFGGREFGQRQEIIALRTLLAAIDNPHDEISVVGALRLPLLGCSDPDLARHRAQARSFNYLSERSPVPAVEVCMTQLREWHTARADGTPSELVQRIYRDTVMVQLAALSPNGEQRVANLLKALELARAAENSGAVSLGAFLRILKRFEEAQSKFDDPVSAESGDDVVSLMTCHKAKGLEFPRVILYRLAQARRFRQGPIYQRQSGELELTLTSAVRTSGFERAFLFDRMRGMAESKRLLYVAMTRAKQALIVPAPLEAKQWSDEAWTLGAFLLERYPLSATGVPDTTGKEFKCWELPAPVLGLENEHLLPMFGSEPSRDLQSADAQAERDAWAAQLQRLRARLNAPAARERGRPTGETVADNEAALRVGSAVHRALEQLDYSDRQAAEFARNVLNTDPDLPAGEQARALQLVTTALHSPALAALRAGAIRLSREVPFACAEQDVVHEGKIDLIIEQQNTIAIVDYKTDSITAKDVPERIERHRAQLLSYCTVLRRLYPDKPVHAYLFFLEPEQLVPVADVAT